MGKLLALGDCNMEGVGALRHRTYIKSLAKQFGLEVLNCGHTMSTTREMLKFFERYYTPDVKLLIIQYGLVDSWKTFKYAPYILYYPDNIMRKTARKIVKKYKKISRSIGLNNILGEKCVVPIDEYRANITSIIQCSTKDTVVILIDTVPNKDENRNKMIKKYNNALTEVANSFPNCIHVPLYEHFKNNSGTLYMEDGTHINKKGYDYIAATIIKYLNLKGVVL